MSEELLDIAHRYLKKVKRSGNEDIMAVCPFHRKADGSEERGPSFSMNINTGLWFCHSCHERGNLFSFLRNLGLSREDMYQQHKSALIGAAQYRAPAPDVFNPVEPTKEYLDESFLTRFNLCPQLLLDEGFPEPLLQQFRVGYDELHQRITFPLYDSKGRLVGISGRSITNARPRYKVYDKEYLAFDLSERKTEKRAILWNVHNVFARLYFEEDPASRYVVVVEGFKALMRVAQAGISSVVGLLGSHMSQEQQWLLERLNHEGCTILLMMDNDEAGRAGQADVVLRLNTAGLHPVRVVPYPAIQPSDLQPTEITSAIFNAQPAMTWLAQTTTSRPKELKAWHSEKTRR